MAANKQDPRYFKYSPFPKRQCAVTGSTGIHGEANYLSGHSNTIWLSADTTNPVVVTWANGYDPFPVDYAYRWTLLVDGPTGWTGFSSGTHYLYIDYDPDIDSVTYGSTTVAPNDDVVSPSYGAGVHWFNTANYKMYESVASVWTERIRVFVGECVSNGTLVTSVITYAYNGRWISEEQTVPILGAETSLDHNIGSNKLSIDTKIRCKTSEGIAIAGNDYDSMERYWDGGGTNHIVKSMWYNRLKFYHKRAETYTHVFPISGANSTVATSTNWRYIFSAERRY